MADNLSNPDRLERELGELQARLKRSIEVLGQLESVQLQLAGMIETYNSLKGLLEVAENTVGDLGGRFDALKSGVEDARRQHASEHQEHLRQQMEATEALARQNEEQWLEYKRVLSKAQEDINAGNANLRTEVGLKVEDLRGSVESRVQGFHDTQQRLEGKLTSSLETMNAKLDAVGFDADAIRDELSLLQQFSEESTDRVERGLRRAIRSGEAATSMAKVGRVLGAIAIVLASAAIALHVLPIDLAALTAP